jgi:hypothetical protein
MTCTCGHEFCFICGADYKTGHFTWGDGPGCRQFDENEHIEVGLTREEWAAMMASQRR